MPRHTVADRRRAERLVSDLHRGGYLRDSRIRDAFLRVPRELFLPDVATRDGLDAVYSNVAFPTKIDASGTTISSSSEPGVMAVMLANLELHEAHRVLEIGAGTGYNSALIAELIGSAGRVTTIDIDDDVVDRARRSLKSAGYDAEVVCGDGRQGWSATAPYDRIIVTTSCSEIASAWSEQLVDGGLLEVPLALNTSTNFPQAIMTLQKRGADLHSVNVTPGGFMTIRAQPGAPAPSLPELTAIEKLHGTSSVLGQVVGRSLESLTSPERQRALALSLGVPRRREPSLSIDGTNIYNLHAFLALAISPASFVGYLREDLQCRPTLGMSSVGILRAQPGSLAVLGCSEERVTGIDGFGTDEAESELSDLVMEWLKLGSPAVERLVITASFGSPAGSGAWRTIRRRSNTLTISWDVPIAPTSGARGPDSASA